MNQILGVVGPWQLMAVLLFLGGIVVGIIAIFSSRAKHKARAETLDQLNSSNRGLSRTSSKREDSSRRNEMGVEGKVRNTDSLEKLERLNKLKESGALTEEEFNSEKKKIIG